MTGDPRTYQVAAGGEVVDRFRTAACEDCSADEVAICHLITYSVFHGGPYVLAYVDGGVAVPICEATHGEPRLLVEEDAVASDSMHAGPHVTTTAPARKRVA